VAIAVDNVRNLQRLQAQTYIDDVTGFYNTRYLVMELDRLIPQVRRQGSGFSLLFMDLDRFKEVVDRHGHLRGSKVLAEVARVIHGVLGPRDSLVRYGGDEFVVLLPGRSQPEALALARVLRQSLNRAPFLQDEGLNLRLTASYGIATVPEDAQDREGLLAIADRALFSSKGRGRDRIMLGRNLTPAENV
jgi:diguanylate cyclase (GGDEF)-like protein